MPNRVPVWLMGLSNSTFGMYGGFITFSLPQLLAERHVPEARIAAITAAVVSPGCYGFVLSPMLDVRFSRRWYATFFAALAALLLTISIFSLSNLAVLEAAMLAGFWAVGLSSSALGGWLSSVCGQEEENNLSAWFNVANIGVGGLMIFIVELVIHHLPLRAAGIVLGALIFLPAVIFLWIPAPGPDRRLASESFREFFGEIWQLLRKRAVLIAIVLFAAPASTFALTNILGGLGDDFHCSSQVVSLVGSVGMTAAGIAGSLLFPLLARRMALRPLYLAIGFLGCLFTLGLMLLPRNAASFALANVGENLFQAVAFTGMFAIIFETIGQKNPLAATTFSVLNASALLPLVYMQVVDGRAYSRLGVNGSYLADGCCGLAACLALAGMLRLFTRTSAT
jgi:PAT family beta-lactamase induction signal transducer AmpG